MPTPRCLSIISMFYNTGTAWALSTKQVIEKLKLLTDAEFAELEFSLD